MRRIFYILLITIAFLLVGSWVGGDWVSALPVAIIGACLGWALTEFTREIHAKK